VLSIAGIAGLGLAVLGWTQRGTGLVSVQAATSPAASRTVSAAPAKPGAAAAPSSPAAAPSPAAAGPLLSGEPYASFAYQVWPGPLSADGKAALAGFDLKVTRQGSGIAVRAVQDGHKMTSVSHFYPDGAKVYILDSNLGDEGGSIDYNVTDDGVVVTNTRGEVLP
jgi:hypothetical protein